MLRHLIDSRHSPRHTDDFFDICATPVRQLAAATSAWLLSAAWLPSAVSSAWLLAAATTAWLLWAGSELSQTLYEPAHAEQVLPELTAPLSSMTTDKCTWHIIQVSRLEVYHHLPTQDNTVKKTTSSSFLLNSFPFLPSSSPTLLLVTFPIRNSRPLRDDSAFHSW